MVLQEREPSHQSDLITAPVIQISINAQLCPSEHMISLHMSDNRAAAAGFGPDSL